MVLSTSGMSVSGSGYASDIAQVYERNQEATLYVGNLDYQVDEDLLFELFVQCGPLRNVHIPRDKITGIHQSYGFVEFENEFDSDYCLKVMNLVKIFGKPLRLNKASQDKRTLEVGANLFVGNLEPEVDDKLFMDTFSSFGVVLSARVARDPDTGVTKNYGFVAFDSFEASDAALAAMNGQFLCNRPIHVSYAYKKDTRGERHGSAAERLIASNRPQDRLKANTIFANVPTPSNAPPPMIFHGPPPIAIPGGGPPPSMPSVPPPRSVPSLPISKMLPMGLMPPPIPPMLLQNMPRPPLMAGMKAGGGIGFLPSGTGIPIGRSSINTSPTQNADNKPDTDTQRGNLDKSVDVNKMPLGRGRGMPPPGIGMQLGGASFMPGNFVVPPPMFNPGMLPRLPGMIPMPCLPSPPGMPSAVGNTGSPRPPPPPDSNKQVPFPPPK